MAKAAQESRDGSRRGREPLTTPLQVVQLPRLGTDPPPTSHGASARVPIPQGRPASSVQPRAVTTYLPSPPSQCVPAAAAAKGHTPRPGVPTWFPRARREAGDHRDSSHPESGRGPRAPRVAGPSLPIIPQAMKCRGMASWVLCSLTKWKGSFLQAQTEKETKVVVSPAGRTQDIGLAKGMCIAVAKKINSIFNCGDPVKRGGTWPLISSSGAELGAPSPHYPAPPSPEVGDRKSEGRGVGAQQRHHPPAATAEQPQSSSSRAQLPMAGRSREDRGRAGAGGS